MAVFLAAKKLRALYPVDDTGEEVMAKLGQGEIVTVEIKRPRNVRMHRLFWALASLAWEQTDHAEYPTAEDLATHLKLITGHYDRREIVFEGKRYPVLTPRSISFAAMSQDDFSAFFDRCCDWILANVIPGVTREDLRDELERMTGAKVG